MKKINLFNTLCVVVLLNICACSSVTQEHKSDLIFQGQYKDYECYENAFPQFNCTPNGKDCMGTWTRLHAATSPQRERELKQRYLQEFLANEKNKVSKSKNSVICVNTAHNIVAKNETFQSEVYLLFFNEQHNKYYKSKHNENTSFLLAKQKELLMKEALKNGKSRQSIDDFSKKVTQISQQYEYKPIGDYFKK